MGEPYSDEGTDTLVLYVRVYYNPSTVGTHHKASVSIICLFSFYKEKTSVFLATIQKICSVNSSDDFAEMSSRILLSFFVVKMIFVLQNEHLFHYRYLSV